MKTLGVSFDTKHSYNDWGLILQSWDIELPQLKTEIISPSTMNGHIDLADYLGERFYENRTLTISFAYLGAKTSFHTIRSTVANYLHGKVMQIVFDDDLAYYYSGRCTVDSLRTVSNEAYVKLVIVCDVDPYKYEINSNGTDWLWDPFSFEDGIINTNRVTVSGSATVTLANRDMIVSPEITSTAAMTLTFNKKTYAIKAGKQKMYGIRLPKGESTMTFTGNGTVTISYRGGTF